jgi:hypothetical protein
LSKVNKGEQVKLTEVDKHCKVRQITVSFNDLEMHKQHHYGNYKEKEFPLINNEFQQNGQQPEPRLERIKQQNDTVVHFVKLSINVNIEATDHIPQALKYNEDSQQYIIRPVFLNPLFAQEHYANQ